MKLYDELLERGYIAESTHENEIRDILNNKSVTFYIGIDATADSLHIGHFLTLVVLKRMQEAGHRPIILLGGGTTLIGDPTGKDEMRAIVSSDIINSNAQNIKKQISKFIDFSDNKAILVNNADWLCSLNYIEFLRDYGHHFNVNRMLQMDTYKNRLKDGLTLLEFNYMPMQAYDFLHLFREYGCILQMGGSDQWSNIIGGVDLVRKIEKSNAYGLTFNLITNSDGVKMGKTIDGALWIDEKKTSAYEFFQYWRNVEDASVEMLLYRFTFLDIKYIKDMFSDKYLDINKAKEILAFEITKLVHGEEEALKSLKSAKALFSGDGNAENMPTTNLTKSDLGRQWIDIFVESDLVKSKSEARRLIEQNGISLNNLKMKDIYREIKEDDFNDFCHFRRGKKIHHRFNLRGE